MFLNAGDRFTLSHGHQQLLLLFELQQANESLSGEA